MIGYHIVEPEVAGGWGENTQFSRTRGHPVFVHELHYKFDGWLGDQLLESTPCYVVTDQLARELGQSQLSGFTLAAVTISTSEQFQELYPGRELPEFVWLKVEGIPAQDDFGQTPDLQLVVSARALAVLQRAGIDNASIRAFEG